MPGWLVAAIIAAVLLGACVVWALSMNRSN